MSFKKYISDSKMFEYDKHYRECVQNNHPFIKARLNHVNGNYNVQIDLMPCNYIFSEEGTKHLKIFFDDEIKYIESNNFPKSSSIDYSVDKELSWIDGIFASRLDLFCEKLYELSQKYQKHLESN